MVTEHLSRAKYKNRVYLLQTNDFVSKENLVQLVFSYDPHLKAVNKIIRRNHKHLHADQLVRSVFIPAPFLSFRTVRNLGIHLVCFELYPLGGTTGSSKCYTPRCQVRKVLKECHEFSSHVTKEIFKINHCFDCNSKYLI